MLAGPPSEWMTQRNAVSLAAAMALATVLGVRVTLVESVCPLSPVLAHKAYP